MTLHCDKPIYRGALLLKRKRVIKRSKKERKISKKKNIYCGEKEERVWEREKQKLRNRNKEREIKTANKKKERHCGRETMKDVYFFLVKKERESRQISSEIEKQKRLSYGNIETDWESKQKIDILRKRRKCIHIFW